MTTHAFRFSRVRVVAIAMFLALAVVTAVLATRKSADLVIAYSPLRGKLAPSVSGDDLNGKPVRLSDYRGKYVVVNFFASWCAPCRQEHPELLSFAKEHGTSDDAAVMAVLFDDQVAPAKSLLDRIGSQWSTMQDPKGEVALAFGVRGPPESFLIDKDGYVRAHLVGTVTKDGLDKLIAQVEKQDA